PVMFSMSSPATIPTQAHSYGEEGPYTVNVTVKNNTTNLSGTANFQVNVSDPSVLAVGVPVNATAGTSFSGSVATFTDPGGAEPNPADLSGTINSHYQVTSINWGDGTVDTSTAALSFGGSPGSTTAAFTVSG